VGVNPALLSPILSFPRQGEGTFTDPCQGETGETQAIPADEKSPQEYTRLAKQLPGREPVGTWFAQFLQGYARVL
jgi:hypothetical protein